MKDAFYFYHDCNARRDEKLLALRMRHGWEGYGLFWAILELLSEANDYLSCRDYNIVAYALHTSSALVKSIVEDFGLFTFTDDGKRFYSERLSKELTEQKTIQIEDIKITLSLSEKRSEAGRKGGIQSGIARRLKNAIVDKVHSDNAPRDEAKSKQNEAKFVERKEEKKKEEIPPYNPLIEERIKEEKREWGEKRTAFLPPTPKEVNEYVVEKGLSIDAERFVNFYESKGWMVGKNKMKEWKAAARNWAQREQEQRKQTQQTTNTTTLRNETALDTSKMNYTDEL